MTEISSLRKGPVSNVSERGISQDLKLSEICSWEGVGGCYLHNRVFLSRNYPLIVATRKFDVVKANNCPRS